MTAARETSDLPRELRGLSLRRIFYRPGLGVCSCPSCTGLVGFGRRAGMHLRIGSPNPNCTYVNREGVFAREWAKEHGYQDVAQLLMTRPSRPGERSGWRVLRSQVAFWLTLRERVILATVIQWLGTNVGWCFLESCIRKCGYDLVKREEAKREEEHVA